MKVIGQPENYSEMLERIFVTTLATGFVCTVWLGIVLPDVRTLLDLFSTPADVGPIKGIKVLYLVVPLFIAVVSRIIKLHDKISDVLGMRRVIDVEWILSRQAGAVGFQVDDDFRAFLRSNRKLMYDVFYPFVTMPDAKIDKQLVRSALDNLGWMWSFVEAAIVVLLTGIIFAVRGEFVWFGIVGAAVIALSACAVAMWFACKRTTAAEVDAIVADPAHCNRIRACFTKATTGSGLQPALPSPPVTTTSSEHVQTLDLFISHASEDKAEVARPLYEALIKAGLSVWFDEATLELGDSLRKKIDDGLARCRYGVVILSPTFLSKQWTQMELDGLVSRETSSGEKAILPIWHKIDHKTLVQRSPILAGRLAASTDEGIDGLVTKILRVVRKS